MFRHDTYDIVGGSLARSQIAARPGDVWPGLRKLMARVQKAASIMECGDRANTVVTALGKRGISVEEHGILMEPTCIRRQG